MRQLGCKYTVSEKRGEIKIAPKKAALAKELEIDCCESGATLRFLIPIALTTGRDLKFTGRGRLLQRPQKPYLDMFDKKGILYECTDEYIKL